MREDRCFSVSVALLLALVTGTACAPHRSHSQHPHSFARPEEVAVRHLDLDVTVDFEGKTIEGRATLSLENRAGANRLYLDTRDLDIRGVSLGEDETPASFELGRSEPYLGRPLIVEIHPETEIVHVDYATRPEAAALQWLEPRQTGGGEHEFLYSQSQAILARTWIPCQDTPGVRMTYEATVRVPRGLVAVMSAENPTGRNDDGVYQFRMPQPIPSYLMALAVGDLEFRALGDRTGVYAEPSVVDAAAWEFADTEKMMETAERLYGPYRWGRYDILVLPPSFPFGGMENPRLTFATPTVLAGDRSLTALVAHELAHSWSGNLVTNANWNGFWLNEGFTVYLERRIMEELYGRSYVEMLTVLGVQELKDNMEELGADSPDTHLELDLAGRDPDDGLTDVPYEKGYLFLRMLEEALGREAWDEFLRGYFDAFAFKPMTTARFLDYLRARILEDPALEDRLQLDAWAYGPGLPDNAPEVHSEAFRRVETQLRAWLDGARATDLETAGWTTHEWLYFLRSLRDSMTHERMSELDEVFGFSGRGNSEILHVWLLYAISGGYEAAFPALERFLVGMGRRKFLRPLYEKLSETPEGLEMARRIYREARPGYHAVSTGAIDDILGWGE